MRGHEKENKIFVGAECDAFENKSRDTLRAVEPLRALSNTQSGSELLWTEDQFI